MRRRLGRDLLVIADPPGMADVVLVFGAATPSVIRLVVGF